MNNKISLESAIRVVGQLLLHNSTTGTAARNSLGNKVFTSSKDACNFCYIGACWFVAERLLLSQDSAYELTKICDNVCGYPYWDGATNAQRTEWATKLANYKENE